MIALILLGYGIVRIGVGGALLAQAFDIVSYFELAEATVKVKEFIEIRANKQLVPFSVTGYFAYIMIMGILLTTGAIGTIIRRKWGITLLWIYIACHAALFINYQEINPKIFVLALQIVLLLALIYLRPSKPVC